MYTQHEANKSLFKLTGGTWTAVTLPAGYAYFAGVYADAPWVKMYDSTQTKPYSLQELSGGAWKVQRTWDNTSAVADNE